MQTLIPAAVVGVGALAHSVWGYWNARKEFDEVWDWRRFFETIIPPFVLAFFLAYTGQIELANAGDWVMHLFAGFGWAKVQNKLGWN